jgi:hypothetical protein
VLLVPALGLGFSISLAAGATALPALFWHEAA